MRAPSPRRLRPLALAWAVVAYGSFALPAPSGFAQEELSEPPEVTLERDAQPAAPLSKEADKRARELFEKGRVAFADGQYRDAWEHFREAYKLSKRPALLYNVGQSADRMRMDREALEAFRLYLKKLPDAENRKEVESRVRYLEERLRNESTAGQGPPLANPDTLEDTPADAPADDGIDAYADAEMAAGDPSRQEPEGPDDVPGPKDPDEEILPDGQPTRSGWYFRLDLGLGLLRDSLSETQVTLSSVTASGLFAVGYTVTEGVVVGGAITGDWGLSPTATNDAGGEADVGRANFSTLSAFAEYYLSPRKHGWHLLGGVGIAQLELSDMSAFVGTEDAGGIALLLGGGHEWTVDRAWAVGVFGRIIGSFLSTDTAKHTAFIPSVTFSAVWY